MPYHKTKSEEIKSKIDNTVQQRILDSISKSVHNFHDKLITLGYSFAKKANSNEEAAEKLCAVGEVVYDGFKNDNDIMKQYQDKVLWYTDESLIIAILSNLNYGANISTNEVHNFHDKLITLGYSFAKKANSNEEAAEKLCAVGEVVGV